MSDTTFKYPEESSMSGITFGTPMRVKEADLGNVEMVLEALWTPPNHGEK